MADFEEDKDGGETVAAAQEFDYRFGTMDVIVVAAVLAVTAVIGFYYVWQAQRSKNTREFLVANKNIGLWALILSMTATSLSPGTMLGITMEAYCNGVQLVVSALTFVLGTAFAAYGTVPVLYKLNVSTINQFVEYRFSRFLRIFPAIIYLLHQSVIIAAITYVTALVLSQAIGLNTWLSIILIAGLCIVYSSLGGFAAVIWTDVFQMLVILVTYFIMLVKGTIESGGVAQIWKLNELGNRTTFVHWTSSPISNYTVWSMTIGYFTMGFLTTVTNQSSLQRQLANKSLAGAKKTVMGTVILHKCITVTSVWIGMCVYAKYRDCDLFMAKRILSRDQVTASYAIDVLHEIPGLSGLFVGGILCATLSTLSSYVNAFAAVILMDFIKPLMPKMSDARSKVASKIIGCLYGLLIFVLTGYAKYFGNIVQAMHAIGGTAIGSSAVVYSLGFFVPWANTKGATAGYLVSLGLGWWLSIGRMLTGNSYITAPLSTRGCPTGNSSNGISAGNGNLTWEALTTGSHSYFDQAPASFTNINTTMTSIFASYASTSIDPIEDESASIFRSIIPLWFASITMCGGLIVGIAVSLLTGSSEEVEKVDANLISPFAKALVRCLPKDVCKRLAVSHLLYREKKFLPPNNYDFQQTPPIGVELELLKQGLIKNGDDVQTTFKIGNGSAY